MPCLIVSVKDKVHMKELGPRLRSIREELGISRRELAKVWRCTVANISQIETGTRDPRVSHLIKFAKLTGVSLDELTAGVVLKKRAS